MASSKKYKRWGRAAGAPFFAMQFACPYCDGRVNVEQPTRDEKPTAAHTLPACEPFEKEGADAYIGKALRRLKVA